MARPPVPSHSEPRPPVLTDRLVVPVVEDDLLVRAMIVYMMEEEGFAVVEAASADATVTGVRRFAEIILDRAASQGNSDLSQRTALGHERPLSMAVGRSAVNQISDIPVLSR